MQVVVMQEKMATREDGSLDPVVSMKVERKKSDLGSRANCICYEESKWNLRSLA